MSSYQTIEVKRAGTIEFIDITGQVRDFVRDQQVRARASCWSLRRIPPAGVTINENADPAVPHDIGEFFKRLRPETGLFPPRRGQFAGARYVQPGGGVGDPDHQ